jgi:hypothetical protein
MHFISSLQVYAAFTRLSDISKRHLHLSKYYLRLIPDSYLFLPWLRKADEGRYTATGMKLLLLFLTGQSSCTVPMFLGRGRDIEAQGL